MTETHLGPALLYTPADRPERYTKAWATGAADIVCADLEDAVAPARRPEARRMVREALGQGPPARPGTLRAVRINPWPHAEADLDEVLPGGPDLLVVPKVEDAEALAAVARRAGELAAAHGHAPPRLVAILETARGVADARTLLRAHPAVVACCFGAEDLAADMGLRRTAANAEVLAARQWVALAAAAAGLPAYDMIVADVRDVARCRREAEEARGWGYAGKMCIHPHQAAAVRQAFEPSAEEVAWARRVVEAAQRGGIESGGVAVVDGGMVDVPVIRRARRTLARATPAG